MAFLLVAEITHLRGLLQGSNSLSREDARSLGTNLSKSVEKKGLQKELEQGFLADSRIEAEAQLSIPGLKLGI